MENEFQTPPKFADRFLKWYCRAELWDEIQGDLLEEFQEDVEDVGLRKARLLYWMGILSFFRWYAFKKSKNVYLLMLPDMLSNYLKIAYRNLIKHTSYSIINILGLSFGMTCFILISLYVVDELSFDSYHENADRVYRVVSVKPDASGKDVKIASTSFNASTALLAEVPEVEKASKVFSWGRVLIKNPENDKSFYITMSFVEPQINDILTFDWLEGNPETAYNEPNSVVLTKSMSDKLFGNVSTLGKLVDTGRFDEPMKVTGVIADFPKQSHLTAEALFSFATLTPVGWYERSQQSDWTSTHFPTYVLLKDAVSSESVANKLTEIVKSKTSVDSPLQGSFSLQAIKDIHFYSEDIRGFNVHPGQISYVYIFSIIAVFILLIASVNYMNLATSKSSSRGKEIGIRKVSGAVRSSLIGQFLTESIFISTISMVLALIATFLLLPSFNQFAEKELSFGFLENIELYVGIAATALFIGIFSGGYPAFYLSKFQPANILKASHTAQSGSKLLRKSLVIFQFTLSTIMLIATFVAFQQMSFIRDKNLGFNQEKVIVVDINSGSVRRGFETIRDGYKALPDVKQVSVSSRVPGEWKNIPTVSIQTESDISENLPQPYFLATDESFLETYQIPLVDGRMFDIRNLGDSASILINEKAAALLGGSSILGQDIDILSINYDGSDDHSDYPFRAKVIGIVKDFHFQSLHQDIDPLVIAHRNNPMHAIDYFSVRVEGQNIPATIQAMTYILQEVDPKHLFEYHFLDAQIDTFYKEDMLRGKIFATAAFIAIFIACLGLFSLASFTTESRKKEISIRKVMGASSSSIAFIFSKEFALLVFLAFVIASPIAYFVMDSWLQNFAYRISISWWILAISGVTSLLIALGTVSFQSLQAATKNPVNALRD